MADHNLSDSEIVEFKQAFSFIDVNNDGYISKYELRDFMKSLQMKPDMLQIDDMMEEIDFTYSDTHQAIDFSEFLTWMAKIYHSMTESDVKKIFDFFDINGNGYITQKELRRVMSQMSDKHYTDADIKDMIEDVDMSGKGQISYDDFLLLMLGPQADEKDTDSFTEKDDNVPQR